MIRTSSTINGEILITPEIPPKKVLQEIQNLTPLDLNSLKPTHFSTEEVNKNTIHHHQNTSFVSDDINNSENTRIIGSGPSDFENNDTITASSSDDDSTSIFDDYFEDIEDEENIINYEIVKEFLISHKNVYQFDNENFALSEEQFLKSIEIVETFNQVVCGLYDTEIDVEKIDFKSFLKSILNPVDTYFNKAIKELLKILIYANQDILNEITLFGLNIFNIVNHQLELSIKTIVSILFKIFCSSVKHVSQEKSNLFSKSHSSLEERVDCVENLRDLSIDEKLELFRQLIDFFVQKKIKFFRSNLSNLEENILKTSRNLIRLNNQKEMIECGYGNLNHFIFDNDDSLNENNYLNELRGQINQQNKLFISLKEKFEGLMRLQPFSQVFIQDQNFILYLWHFECLKNSLMIEKRTKSENYSFEKANFDFSIEKSEWFLITDSEILKKLMTAISSNIFDSKFVNGILKVIDKSFANTTLSELKNMEEVHGINNDNFDSTLLVLFDDFKQRLVESNFIHYELVIDKVDHSVTGFNLSESYRKFNQMLSSSDYSSITSNNEKISFYSELVLTLYGMISRNVINKKFSPCKDTWEQMVLNSKSLEQIKLSIFLLDNNIHWEKTQVGEICKLCVTEISSKNYEDVIKIQCKNCPISYHLSCLAKAPEFGLDSNNNEIPIKILKSKRTKFNLLCFSCDKKLEEEQREANELNKQKCEEVANELTSIEVNNYRLRFNKLRATNLDNKMQEIEQSAQKRSRRAKKSFIASSTDDAKSIDSDYAPKKKTYKRVKLIESSSSSSVDVPKTRGRKKKLNDHDESNNEESVEKEKNEQYNIENDAKRARLGLRIRPKKIERLY